MIKIAYTFIAAGFAALTLVGIADAKDRRGDTVAYKHMRTRGDAQIYRDAERFQSLQEGRSSALRGEGGVRSGNEAAMEIQDRFNENR